MTHAYDTLIAIARRKSEFDQNNTWFKGAKTYLDAINKEVLEVIEEIPLNRQCYLEDELADVLWNTLNAIIALEKEQGICAQRVLMRACKKYEARLSSIEAGESWQGIKQRQKHVLEREYQQANSNREN